MRFAEIMTTEAVLYSSKVFPQMSILTVAVRLTVKRSNFAINYQGRETQNYDKQQYEHHPTPSST
jgi:hypothetical protein